jgi:hypothetical protein
MRQTVPNHLVWQLCAVAALSKSQSRNCLVAQVDYFARTICGTLLIPMG